jgi:hypothetical protein
MASPLASISREDAAQLVECYNLSGRLKHCSEMSNFVTGSIPSLVAFALTFNIVSLIWQHHRSVARPGEVGTTHALRTLTGARRCAQA